MKELIERLRLQAQVKSDAFSVPKEDTFDWDVANALEQQASRIIELEAQKAELLAALKKMYRAYVNLLESGRDRILSLGGDCDPVDYMGRVDCNLIECRATIANVKGGAA